MINQNVVLNYESDDKDEEENMISRDTYLCHE